MKTDIKITNTMPWSYYHLSACQSFHIRLCKVRYFRFLL